MQLFFSRAFWQSMWVYTHTDTGVQSPPACSEVEDLGAPGPGLEEPPGVWGDRALTLGDLTAVLTSPSHLGDP